MWNRKRLFLFLTAILTVTIDGKATVEQMTKTAEMFRTVCTGKIKVKLELVDELQKGNFPDDKDVKCYVNCALEMMQMIRKGKLNYDATMKQIDLLMPDELGIPMKKALDICRTSAEGIKNNCEAAYAMVQCLYKNNPHFFFP